MKIESSKKYIKRLKMNKKYIMRKERELFDEDEEIEEMMRNRNTNFMIFYSGLN